MKIAYTISEQRDLFGANNAQNIIHLYVWSPRMTGLECRISSISMFISRQYGGLCYLMRHAPVHAVISPDESNTEHLR